MVCNNYILVNTSCSLCTPSTSIVDRAICWHSRAEGQNYEKAKARVRRCLDLLDWILLPECKLLPLQFFKVLFRDLLNILWKHSVMVVHHIPKSCYASRSPSQALEKFTYMFALDRFDQVRIVSQKVVLHLLFIREALHLIRQKLNNSISKWNDLCHLGKGRFPLISSSCAHLPISILAVKLLCILISLVTYQQ